MPNNFENNNLPQIVPDKNITLTNKQLATVNKSLSTINRQKFIEFLARNEGAADCFVEIISRYSPVLNEAVLTRCPDKWDWAALSWNESLPWSEAFSKRTVRVLCLTT